MSNETYKWWEKGIVYEVYVRSFQDSNDDGIGDLRGIINRLDYLKWLGVDAIWLTPVYPSPMKDFGYDVSDYSAIDPLFGDMADFEELVKETHSRGMKLVLDLVPNHTSDQHPWFIESKSSKNNPKRNWYYWKDAVEGHPPNNWLGVLGGSAWEWDERTQQYYYHAFLKEQPDLNLRNPEVVEAIKDVIRFWLEKGIDGFRIDVMWHMIKDDKWRDNPENPHYTNDMPDCDRLQQVYNCDQPDVHALIKELRQFLDGYNDKVMIGEIYLPLDRIITYYGDACDGANLPANFQLLFTDWDAQKVSKIINDYEAALPAHCWPNWVIGNHDRARLIKRIGAGQCRVAAVALLTLRGTPTIYYGDEIGMEQVPIPESEVQDPQGLLMPGKGLSRDPQRTPMQWDTEQNAGFSSGKPWLRLAEDYKTVNVETEQNDPDSILNLYHQLTTLRKSEPALNCGAYKHIYTDDSILAYTRVADGSSSYLIILNFTGKSANLQLSEEYTGTVAIDTLSQQAGKPFTGALSLKGNQALVVKLN